MSSDKPTHTSSFSWIVRQNLARTTALSAIALAAAATPSLAFAQSECGMPGDDNTVVCSPDDNPYGNGITYFPADELTIVLEDGVVVDTSDGFNNGLLLFGGDDDLTVNGATNTSITAGQFGFSVLAATNAGDITLNLDQVTGILSGINASSATGAITVTANNVTTSGNGATGISATGNSGDILVDVGTVTTTGMNSVGINADTDGDISVNFDNVTSTGNGINATGGSSSIVAVNGGSVTTSGNNAIGVRARGGFANGSTGTIGVDVDNVSTTGTGADGISVESRFSSAAVDAGTVATTGDNARGIVAIGGNGANISFDSITTQGSGATGVAIPSGSLFVRPTNNGTITGGSISTTGDDAIGINVSDGTLATVAVDSITTTGAGSTGVNIAAGTGGFFGTASTPSADLAVGSITTSGDNAVGVDATVTDDLSVTVGNVSTSGAASNAVLATSTGGKAGVTVNADVSVSGDMLDAIVIDAADTASLNIGTNGSISGTANNVTITSVNGTTIDNAGTLMAADNGFAIQAIGGAARLSNTGTLTSDIQLTANNDRLVNAGTFVVTDNPDFGDGDDQFINSGTVSVRPMATTTGMATFTGLETFRNSGLIDLRNGQVGDTLNLPGSYNGFGNAQLGLDVDLAAGNSDRLNIGGAATGSTMLLVDPSQTVLNSGTVFAQAGAMSDAGAFVTGNDNGIVRLDVVYDPNALTYSLVGTPGDTAYRTATFAEGARNLWYKSAEAWSAHMREVRDGVSANGAGAPGARIWMQMFGSVEDRDNNRSVTNFGITRNIDTGYKQDYFGGQIGIDFGGAAGGESSFAFGLTGGYINSNLNYDGSADRLEYDAVNGGLYASYNAGSFFVNALGKYDYYFVDSVTSAGQFAGDLDSSVYGGQIEAGIRFGSDSLFFEPVGSISYVKSDLDDLGIQGSTLSFDEDDGFRGKLGARAGTTFQLASGVHASAYVGGNYVHEFAGDDTVNLTSGGTTLQLQNFARGDYGEGVVGVNIGSANGVSGFIEAYGAKGADYKAGGGRAGLRFRF